MQKQSKYFWVIYKDSQVVPWERVHLPVQEVQETWVQTMGQEDNLEKEMATYLTIFAWEIPWTEEPGGLQSKESQELDMTLRVKQQQVYFWGSNVNGTMSLMFTASI